MTTVVKIGSSTLTDERGRLRLGPMAGRVAELCALWRSGHRVVLVSSGAVSAGMGMLGLEQRPTEVVDLQAASAVGQGRLYHTYSQLFGHEEVATAQVLLTAFDISARTQYLNARNTLARLLEWRVLPIVNENDTTSTDELRFGDNDLLAAQVSLLVQADLLLLLTDTEGLYRANPKEDPEASIIQEVNQFSELDAVETQSRGPLGSGGMESKVRAARMATSGGVATVIASGVRPGVIEDCVRGSGVGTRFRPRERSLGAFKLWLLYGKPSRGRVTVDEGAVGALRAGSSLLPVGITGLDGDFASGDAVTIVDSQGRELGKGVVNYADEELRQVMGLRSGEIADVMSQAPSEAVHRDYLVLVE